MTRRLAKLDRVEPPDGADRPDPTRRRRLGRLDPIFLVSAATVFALFLALRIHAAA